MTYRSVKTIELFTNKIQIFNHCDNWGIKIFLNLVWFALKHILFYNISILHNMYK